MAPFYAQAALLPNSDPHLSDNSIDKKVQVMVEYSNHEDAEEADEQPIQ